MSKQKIGKNSVPYTFSILSFLFLTLSCRLGRVDIEREKKAIRALMDNVKETHLMKDAVQFYEPIIRNGMMYAMDKYEK